MYMYCIVYTRYNADASRMKILLVQINFGNYKIIRPNNLMCYRIYDNHDVLCDLARSIYIDPGHDSMWSVY